MQPERHVRCPGRARPQHGRRGHGATRKCQEPATRLIHESTPRLFPFAYTRGQQASSTAGGEAHA